MPLSRSIISLNLSLVFITINLALVLRTMRGDTSRLGARYCGARQLPRLGKKVTIGHVTSSPGSLVTIVSAAY
jgi:hypothetical protein